MKIKIGDKLDYIEYDTDVRLPVKITNIFFDGDVFLIEFKHKNDRAIGVSQYIDKFHKRLLLTG